MRKLLLLAAVAAILPAAAPAQTAVTPDTREVLKVDRPADDGQPGSLRWALETSNAAPGRYRIEIVPTGLGAIELRIDSPLPPIKGPVKIEGTAWKADGRYAVIDGSGYVKRDLKDCPGANPAEYGTNIRTTTKPGLALIDTREVELTGLEVRNFCIGVLVLRTSNSVFHDNRFVRNIGGAGVMFSGDDGQGGSTATTTINNKVLRNVFYENGDGLELTRGAAFNLVADNVFDAGEDNLEPSQGIEILRGNDNTVVRNLFQNYTDGLQINWGSRNYLGANVFRANGFGISLTGDGNIVDGNVINGNAVGVAVRSEAGATANRISRNRIFANAAPISRCSAGGSCDPKLAKGGIVLGLPGLEHASFVGKRGYGVSTDTSKMARICPEAQPCQGLPNGGQAAPVIEGVKAGAAEGAVKAAPGQTVTIELFANRTAESSQGENFVADQVVAANADGEARFAIPLPKDLSAQSLTATATSAGGATSSFSAPSPLAR
ncbi:3-dehydroshikimate dehydratase [Caulobacter sp. D5]|uniref:NosD domain-containing protein n=1 Tax=Caulobacter sp. D5 TaxID=357400 RepID=UPI000D7372B9|nr:NosD domain-containing protein [Caulobacter sp. D5]PXA93356.1 3-dehydroshikimate dehydratase [Caulobacter sp. D5]